MEKKTNQLFFKIRTEIPKFHNHKELKVFRYLNQDRPRDYPSPVPGYNKNENRIGYWQPFPRERFLKKIQQFSRGSTQVKNFYAGHSLGDLLSLRYASGEVILSPFLNL